MKIDVVSQSSGQCLKLLQSRPRELNVIAICSSGNPTPNYLNYYSQNLSRSWIMEQFDDITELIDGKKLITTKQLTNFLNYVTPDKDNVVVAGELGTSRAPAIAAILQAREVGAVKAFNGIDPKSNPNPYIIQLGSDLLNMPELVTSFNDWTVTKGKKSVGKSIMKFFGLGQ